MRGAALLFAAAALAGCGGGDDEPGPPGVFVTGLIRDLGSGKTAKAWESLHPLHQKRVSRARYVECERHDGFGGTVTKVDVLDVKEEPATIPGQFGRQPSTAVTVGVTLATADSKEPERFTLTAHIFDTDGRWSWVIGPVDYAAYMTGNCPAQAST
ncbi:MAG TPA: hypothetical protein VM049_00620 [Gaiellaceae bacterium]|nr:hypothetical protein [Gaiellaceae bacterium]